jgi:hypothetical protein
MKASPNGKHQANLIYAGEMRFGPPYFRLEIDGEPVPNRIFGNRLCWSGDSRCLATGERLTTDFQYQAGPITRVLLIDLEEKRASAFRKIGKGFAENFRFQENKFICARRYYDTGEITGAEVEISSIGNWKSIGL